MRNDLVKSLELQRQESEFNTRYASSSIVEMAESWYSTSGGDVESDVADLIE